MDRQYNGNKKKISNNGSQSTTPIAKDLETQILVKNGCVFGCINILFVSKRNVYIDINIRFCK
jgi:hypothetical protein